MSFMISDLGEHIILSKSAPSKLNVEKNSRMKVIFLKF